MHRLLLPDWNKRVLARLGGAGALAFCLAACQVQPPVTTYERLSAAPMPEPVTLVMEIDEDPPEAGTVNQWGGRVPESSPTVQVDDTALGDIS